MDELQLEEQQKNIQQRQDEDSYDPNAASRFPDGYTSVGEGVDNTQVEEVDPANVGAVEVTNPQVEDFRNFETLGSSGGVIIDGADLKDISPELLNQLQITPIQNASLDPVLDTDGNIVNTVGDIPDSGNQDQVVDPEDPDPEDPDPEDPDPEDPDPEDPDPEDPDPEDPDPEDPDPEDPDPEDPDPEDPDPEDPDPEDPNGPRGNNGWGNGDDDAPGNSGPNNGAENDETPGKNYDKLVEKFLENHSFNDEYDNRGGKPDFEYDDYVPEDSSDMNIPDVSEPVVHFDIPNYSDDYGAVDFF